MLPRLNRRCELEKAEPAAYANARRTLALLCAGLNNPDGATYTLHSPNNYVPTAATKRTFEARDLDAIGYWPSNSRVNERCVRIVCAGELLLRDAIIQKMVSGWSMAGSFRFHETQHGYGRIGNDPIAFAAAVVGPK